MESEKPKPPFERYLEPEVIWWPWWVALEYYQRKTLRATTKDNLMKHGKKGHFQFGRKAGGGGSPSAMEPVDRVSFVNWVHGNGHVRCGDSDGERSVDAKFLHDLYEELSGTEERREALRREVTTAARRRWRRGCPRCGEYSTLTGYIEGPDLIICGGESGPGARPMHPDWPRAVRDQCKAAGVRNKNAVDVDLVKTDTFFTAHNGTPQGGPIPGGGL